jgi:DNA-binding MarR family transcriptional regulator
MVQSNKLWKTTTPREQSVLIFVGANPLELPLTVTEVIAQSALGSPAVVHKAMLVLCKAGLLSRKSSKEDQRIKQVNLTAKGLALLSSLDALLLSCAKTQ